MGSPPPPFPRASSIASIPPTPHPGRAARRAKGRTRRHRTDRRRRIGTSGPPLEPIGRGARPDEETCKRASRRADLPGCVEAAPGRGPRRRRPCDCARPGGVDAGGRRAAARAGASSGGTRSPHAPPSRASGTPPTRVAQTGTPAAIASRTANGRPSRWEGRTKTSAAPRQRAGSVRQPAKTTRPAGRVAGGAAEVGLEDAVADEDQAGARARPSATVRKASRSDAVALLGAEAAERDDREVGRGEGPRRGAEVGAAGRRVGGDGGDVDRVLDEVDAVRWARRRRGARRGWPR